jgi:hypothetical protein
MKKVFSIIALSFMLLFLFSGMVSAWGPGCNATTHIDPAAGNGLVPCGISVDAKGTLTCPCELGHFFIMVFRVFNFAVYVIALPLAGLFIVIGGVLFIISAGNPGLAQKGKNMALYSIIALFIIFGAWLIIDIVLKALGYVLPWNIL